MSKNKKNIFFHLKIHIFTAVKYCCILHGCVCVMRKALFLGLVRFSEYSMLCFFFQFQDSLYQYLKDSVHGFRELVGAPDTPRWNSVLFGGKYMWHKNVKNRIQKFIPQKFITTLLIFSLHN